MKQGFIKVAAATPDIRVADTAFNTEEIIKKMKEAAQRSLSFRSFASPDIPAVICLPRIFFWNRQKQDFAGLPKKQKNWNRLFLSDVLLRWTVSCTTRQRP